MRVKVRVKVRVRVRVVASTCCLSWSSFSTVARLVCRSRSFSSSFRTTWFWASTWGEGEVGRSI